MYAFIKLYRRALSRSDSVRGQRHHADDPVSSSQQLRCGVVYTDTTHGAQGTRQQQPPTAAGSFWDSRNARKYLIGTLDHMRHWPSLPLGWVGRVSRPYTGLPDHALRLSQGVRSKEITPEATREGTPKGARHLGLLSSDTSHGLQSRRSLAPNPPHMQPINIHTIRFPRR